MSRKPIHMVNDGLDSLHEAQQFIELITSAAQSEEQNEPIAVGAIHVAGLLRQAKAHLDNVATALREQEA